MRPSLIALSKIDKLFSMEGNAIDVSGSLHQLPKANACVSEVQERLGDTPRRASAAIETWEPRLPEVLMFRGCDVLVCAAGRRGFCGSEVNPFGGGVLLLSFTFS